MRFEPYTFCDNELNTITASITNKCLQFQQLDGANKYIFANLQFLIICLMFIFDL